MWFQARGLNADVDVDASVLQAPHLQIGAGITIGIGNATWAGTPRIVSWHPMAVLYDNFATEEECDYLLNLSKPEMEPAMLVNSNEMKHVRSKSRTSYGAFFDSFGDAVLSMITHRIAHVAKVPPGESSPCSNSSDTGAPQLHYAQSRFTCAWWFLHWSEEQL
jgi:hypothetical protein